MGVPTEKKQFTPKFSLTLQLFTYKHEKAKLTRISKKERRHCIPMWGLMRLILRYHYSLQLSDPL